MNMEILFEDEEILVCVKPAGIAVQTKRLGQQDMETQLKNYRARKKEPPYIGIVHRLDQPVEGVMVFAKTRGAAASLSKQVQSRQIGKYYYAAGSPVTDQNPDLPPAKGTLTDFVTFDPRTNVGCISEESDKNAKKAVLDYEILGTETVGGEALTCFRIILHTGRHHQIRLQLAHLGYPLAGDGKYGGCALPVIPRGALALCSYRLEFRHPADGRRMNFEIRPKNPVFAPFAL